MVHHGAKASMKDVCSPEASATARQENHSDASSATPGFSLAQRDTL
jgi:hypothetical protein